MSGHSPASFSPRQASSVLAMRATVLVGEVGAVAHAAELSRVDEEHVAAQAAEGLARHLVMETHPAPHRA